MFGLLEQQTSRLLHYQAWRENSMATFMLHDYLMVHGRHNQHDHVSSLIDTLAKSANALQAVLPGTTSK